MTTLQASPNSKSVSTIAPRCRPAGLAQPAGASTGGGAKFVQQAEAARGRWRGWEIFALLSTTVRAANPLVWQLWHGLDKLFVVAAAVNVAAPAAWVVAA